MGIFDYLTGKEGYLPDWKIPEVLTTKKAAVFSVWADPILTRKDGAKTSFKELYSPAGYAEGAGMIREKIMARGTASATALIGPGATSWLGGKQGLYPDWFPGGAAGQPLGKGGVAETAAEIVKDPSGAAVDIMPDWMKTPPAWWTGEVFNLSGVIPEGFGDMSGIGEGISLGMSNMGAMLAQAMTGFGQMPSLPSLTDEEGAPNVALIAALAVAGLGGVYLLTKV